MSRALRLQELFLSRDGLRMHAKVFEEKHEIWGLEDMVAQQLSAEQVLRINQLRYGLAVSIYALNVDTATDNDITDCFAQHLKSDIENREETLYEFLQSFAGNDFDQVSSKQEKIQAYSFPELLFAGTMPMDLFEVLE